MSAERRNTIPSVEVTTEELDAELRKLPQTRRYTASGEFVAQVTTMPFLKPPEILSWGLRTFVLQPDGTYREGLMVVCFTAEQHDELLKFSRTSITPPGGHTVSSLANHLLIVAQSNGPETPAYIPGSAPTNPYPANGVWLQDHHGQVIAVVGRREQQPHQDGQRTDLPRDTVTP